MNVFARKGATQDGRCTSNALPTKNLGVVIKEYRAVAKKGGVCAEYEITDTFPSPPNNVHIKPRLVVEPSGVRSRR